MTEQKRERVQIDMSHAVRTRAKVVALERDVTLVQLVLTGLSKLGDTELTKLIEKELAEKAKPGRPQK